MIYKNFKDKEISMLSLGCMRLPTDKEGKIDSQQVLEMTDYAIKNGINYFDTAYPYHDGMSEIEMGKALKNYPRESFYLATKYPGHQITDNYNPAAIFEEQLKKCGVDYFDFYLLHNIYENSIDVYLDPKWGIVDYFKEQKRLGRIKHLGFSTHGDINCMKRFLKAMGEDMEFCQIQLNWLDWTLQDAKNKVELLNSLNIPIWVMEPVRGGKLCSLDERYVKELKALRQNETVPAWSFRFLQGIKGVTTVLSGMSNMEQLKENIETFKEFKPLTQKENEAILGIAEMMKSSVPCTACKYCVNECPIGLDIPRLISTYNEICVEPSTTPTMWLEALPDDKQPFACIGCAECEKMCPQGIKIPEVMTAFAEKLKKIPKWSDICKEREETAKKLKEG